MSVSGGMLDVGSGHRVHWRELGNPAGTPALLLHGGPGSGCSDAMASFFDLRAWRVVLLDQRGAGRSLPAGSTRCNTTADLVADCERLRAHLGIAQWLLLGGSWGATLAVLYASAHARSVGALLLRALFLAERAEIEVFFDAPGAPPLAWLAAELESGHPERGRRAARRWHAHEQRQARPAPTSGDSEPRSDAAGPGAAAEPTLTDAQLDALVQRYRVQAHYLRHGCFVDDGAVLAACARLPGVPVAFVHGLADRICAPSNAQRAHAAAPGSRLVLVDGAGHDPYAPPMADATRTLLARYAAAADFAC